MGTVYVDNIKHQSAQGSGTITLGASGETINIPSGVTMTNSGTATGFGKVLQVVTTTKQDTFSASITASGWSDVTGLSASITPSSTSNKILILCNCTMALDNLVNRLFIQLKRDGTAIQGALGTQVGSNRRQTNTITTQGTTAGAGTHSFHYLDSPSSTSSLTYQIAIAQGNNDTRTVYVNKSSDDPDAVYIARAASTITLIEIAG